MKQSGGKVFDRIYSEGTTRILFIISVVYVLVVASVGWNCMLSPLYAFRQTQTALSVSYLLKGGPWVAYQTPVLGPPWSIPFEFPLYQWMVALVVKSGLFAIDQAGKFVSELSFFFSLYPLFKILGFLNVSPRQRYIVLTLFCLSPQYLFWSRSFLIEATALSLSLYFLWLVFLCREQLESKRSKPLLLAAVALIGSLAGVVKVTTFFSFMAAACLVLALFAVKAYRSHGVDKDATLRLCLVLGTAVVVPVLAVLAWTSYSDSLKLLNPLAAGYTSAGLKAWNFGTLEQKLSLKTWQTFYSRTLSDLIGNSSLAAMLAAALLLCSKERIAVSLACLGLFLLTLVTFTNLQYVHPYYSYANGVFFLVAAGVVVTDLMERRTAFTRGIGAALLILMLFFCVQGYFDSFWKLQKVDFDFSEIKAAVNAHSREEDVFIVFGNDWSSEIPYHIGRRAAMISTGDLNAPAVALLKKNLRGYRIGGVLFLSRNGFSPDNIAFIKHSVKFFDIAPGFNSVFPWYKKNSGLFMVFNQNP
jgi:hypothetical protein